VVKQSSKTSKSKQNNPASAIRFELLAPYNEDVSLMGSWNDWKPIPMTKDQQGVWCAEVPLEDGDYEYKFQVVSKSYFAAGETLTVADPKALEHTLDNHENSIVRVRNGQRVGISYQWNHDDVPLPPNEQLIIYELHVGDFTGSADGEVQKPGTFVGLIEKLDYLADLGINAIELMPVNEFPGDKSWGYSLRSLYAVENSYGTPDELAQLVDECHARGIRVIHDSVYNHMEMEAPLTRIDYSYWFYEQNPDEGHLHFGPKFNYEHYDENLKTYPARDHVINAMRSWIGTFHMDGIRFDVTRALKYYDLLNWFRIEALKVEGFKPFYTIAEHIPQDGTIAGPEGPMDAAWHDNFYRQMNSTTLGIPSEGREPFNTHEVLRVMDGRQDGFVNPYNTIHYIANHDQERTMFMLGAAAGIFDDLAFRRAKLGATLLLTAPGVPMLWMGEEFGQANDKSLDPRPLNWSLLEHARNQGLFQHYKHLIHLRKSLPALHSDTFEVVLNEPGRGVIGFKRWNAEGNVVLVVANLTNQFAGEFRVQNIGLEDGTWHELIYDYDIQVKDGCLVDALAESEAKVFVRQ
jgi:1,4-alpha-glucan branching enzyme